MPSNLVLCFFVCFFLTMTDSHHLSIITVSAIWNRKQPQTYVAERHWLTENEDMQEGEMKTVLNASITRQHRSLEQMNSICSGDEWWSRRSGEVIKQTQKLCQGMLDSCTAAYSGKQEIKKYVSRKTKKARNKMEDVETWQHLKTILFFSIIF